jgi:hypothetical protein
MLEHGLSQDQALSASPGQLQAWHDRIHDQKDGVMGRSYGLPDRTDVARYLR